jgi:hypothetical protein
MTPSSFDEYDAEPIVRRWRVYLESVSGFSEQYSGYVDVRSAKDARFNLFRCAVAELRQTSFPERSTDCWRFVRAELLD